MPDPHYEHPRLAALYDFDSGWSPERDFYLALPGEGHQAILDLGCGTGLICDAYAAKGHDVTGVDPAPAMLEIARKKPHGAAVEWVQSSAQTFRSEERFDLITMTGHAFQVLLTEEDVAAAMTTMRMHLKPDGLVAFESRNPAFDWAQNWNYEMRLDLPEGPARETRRLLDWDGRRMRFEIGYAFADQTLRSQSGLLFMPCEEIVSRLSEAGLAVDTIHGGWDKSPFDSSSSPEMIFLARRAHVARL